MSIDARLPVDLIFLNKTSLISRTFPLQPKLTEDYFHISLPHTVIVLDRRVLQRDLPHPLAVADAHFHAQQTFPAPAAARTLGSPQRAPPRPSTPSAFCPETRCRLDTKCSSFSTDDSSSTAFFYLFLYRADLQVQRARFVAEF